MKKQRRIDYQKLKPKIEDYEKSHPTATKQDLYKALGISDWIYNTAVTGIGRPNAGKRALKKGVAKRKYSRVVLEPASIAPEAGQFVTAFVLRGPSAAVAQLVAVMQ